MVATTAPSKQMAIISKLEFTITKLIQMLLNDNFILYFVFELVHSAPREAFTLAPSLMLDPNEATSSLRWK